MSENEETVLYQAIRTAVLEAIDVVGIEGVKAMSMFPSSKWNPKNDNQNLKKISKAA